MFHGHKQLSDLQLKERLKEILENDEQCISFLEKLEEKDLSFDELWKGKMRSAVSTSIPVYYRYINS